MKASSSLENNSSFTPIAFVLRYTPEPKIVPVALANLPSPLESKWQAPAGWRDYSAEDQQIALDALNNSEWCACGGQLRNGVCGGKQEPSKRLGKD